MYDVEMMRMLNLIHAENQYIFELVRAGLFLKEDREAITFDAYEKEYKRIMKDIKSILLAWIVAIKIGLKRLETLQKKETRMR